MSDGIQVKVNIFDVVRKHGDPSTWKQKDVVDGARLVTGRGVTVVSGTAEMVLLSHMSIMHLYRDFCKRSNMPDPGGYDILSAKQLSERIKNGGSN